MTVCALVHWLVFGYIIILLFIEFNFICTNFILTSNNLVVGGRGRRGERFQGHPPAYEILCLLVMGALTHNQHLCICGVYEFTLGPDEDRSQLLIYISYS